MRLIQITDCHLHADPEARSRTGIPCRQLERVVAAAAALRPDLVLVTGDVSEDRTAASYALAERCLSVLDRPWFWLPGNHDDPDLMSDCRPFHPEVELGDRRLLIVDTQWPGREGGRIGEARLKGLAERLAEDDRPILVAMHHPPLAVGSAWLDALGLADAEAFWETLADHEHVEAVFCGHIHQAFVGHGPAVAGAIPVYGCPASSDQFLPGSTDFSVDEASRPGFRVIDLHGDALTTWVERVDP
ncbi:metallophosphoesterase family protein [Halomonas beimenensis]|uniref:3',5'-cyclic-nucleotide phosphodiesterase n=1 Tax=Halomonas beimenensis TaxID=475662 RepID=A0A291PAB5_9GAMM|nr:metallophosphoesterase [Halomonas beimenensis]ATJ83792.1 3',5'-cyclic-nucleotide phosphodiesterase [Halomonas beimenensis]